MAKTLKQKMETQGYLSVRQVADLVGLSVYTIYRWIKTGELEGEKVIGHWFVTVDSMVAKIGSDSAKKLGLIKKE